MNATGEKLLYALVGLVVGAASTYVVMDFLHEKELDDIYGELDSLRGDAAAAALEEYQGGSDNVTHIHNHVPPVGLAPEDKIASGGAGDVVGARVVDRPDATKCTHNVSLTLPCDLCAEISVEDLMAEGFVAMCSHGNPIDEDCPECDGEVPVEDSHHVSAPWDIPDASIPTGPGGQPMDEEDILTEEKREAAALEAMAVEDAESVFKLPSIIPDNKVTQPTIMGRFNPEDGSFEINPKMSIKHPDLDEILENDALYPLFGEEAFDILMDSIKEPTPETLRMISIRNEVLHVDFVVQF